MQEVTALNHRHFQGIQTAVDAALLAEDICPVISSDSMQAAKKQSMVIIAGLAIHDESAERGALEHARQHRKEVMTAYRQNVEIARNRTAGLGITPLAVVPKSAWDRICSESELYRLQPDAHGRVPVDTSIVDKHRQRAEIIIGAIWIGMLVIPTVVGATSNTHPVICGIGAFVLSLIASLLFFYDEKEKKLNFWRGAVAKLTISLFAMRSHNKVMRHFFPNLESGGHVYACLDLPTPPKDVADVLLKATSLPLRIAMVGAAIQFTESPERILHRALDDQLDEDQQRRNREWDLARDPIVYYEEGSAVIILAQFGDFAIEQQVVDRVAHSEFLL